MRYSTQILVFLILLNSAAGVVTASGLAEDMGVSPNPGESDAVSSAEEEAQQVKGNSGFGSTLFGVFSSITSHFQAFVGAIFAAPMMFSSLGIPSWFVNFVFAPLYILAATDIIYAISGRVL